MAELFEAGRNCYRIAAASRVGLLVDGENYFSTFAQAAALARHSIIILAWDFDSRTRLHWDEHSAVPATLGPFLNDLVKRRRGLQVYVLDWDYPMLFGTDREFPPLYGFGWKAHRRVHLHYDNTQPVGASHHQKIVVIDDAIAFSGGLDLTSRRWDTCEHRPDNPHRVCNGDPYPPFHDLMAAVDGDAARVLGAIARERWRLATGQTLRPALPATGDRWPAQLKISMADVKVAISRTEPAREHHTEVREVERLYLDMIAAARRYIYIENQYFTAHTLGDALAARLAEPDGPEIVIVLRYLSHGWLEENTMHALRVRLIKQLRAADRWHRLGIYHAFVPGLKPGTCVDIHSKAMIVDDAWLRIGSANVSNRSMGTDTECDLTFASGGEQRIAVAIRDFRDSLLGEHLDVDAHDVRAEIERTGSPLRAIEALHSNGRTLEPFGDLPEPPEMMLEIVAVADPERPVSMDQLVKEFAPVMDAGSASPWRTVLVVALVMLGLVAAWKFTPLNEFADADLVIDYAHDFAGRWWAPLVVVLAYTPACVIMFPRPLITLFAVVAFGAWLGFAYALMGVLTAALVTYGLGRVVRRDTVRRFAGARLNQVSDVLRKRGLLAITALRMVPIAPFIVGSMVAGAIRIKVWHYALGTVLGMLPGTLATTIFGDQLESVLRDSSRVNYWLVGGVVVLFVTATLAVRRWLFGSQSHAQGQPAKTAVAPHHP